MEKIPSNLAPKNNVESTANYEGNHTMCLFSRLRNPIINNQSVSLFYEQEKASVLSGKEETSVVDENGQLKRDEKGEIVFEKVTEFRPFEEFQKEFEERFARASEKTDFDYKDEMPTQDIMHLGFTMFGTQPKMNQKQLNIIASHEKGHILRPYHGEFFDEIFLKVFDSSKIIVPEFYIKYILSKKEDFSDEGLFNDDSSINEVALREEYLRGAFCAGEIVERMSQLKNYFGFTGAEIFTEEHLDYAVEHYVQDTGLDNNMSAMFLAITPETRKVFLQVMNSCGV